MREPVKVPAAVLEGIEACREDGRANMLSWRNVVVLAHLLMHPRTAAWIEGHSKDYFWGVMDGFEADPTPVQPETCGTCRRRTDRGACHLPLYPDDPKSPPCVQYVEPLDSACEWWNRNTPKDDLDLGDGDAGEE